MNAMRHTIWRKEFVQWCKYLFAPEDSSVSSEPGYSQESERWRGWVLMKCILWWGIAVVLPLAFLGR